MKALDTKVIVFNAAAVLITVGALAGLVRTWVFSPTTAPCSERYTSSTGFSLERAGVVLTAADLQSSLSGRDDGVIDNVSIARIANGPTPIVMTVKLPKGSTSPLASASPKGGVSFPWQPRAVRGKTAACLIYNVLLPGDFQFNRGGTLPGLSGAETGMASPEQFSANIVWREGRQGGATLRVTSGGETRATGAEQESFAIPRGRWVKLEQEVVLNTPRQTDGIMRVWVDGSLAIERTDLTYRTRSGMAVSGVAVDVFYGTTDGSGPAPVDTKVSLTPFEIRW